MGSSEAVATRPTVGRSHHDAASDASLVADRTPVAANRRGWQRTLDDCLIPWCMGGFADFEPGLKPPTRDVLIAAIKLAELFSEQGLLPPSRVVPNGEGGLVFERFSYPNVYQVLEIHEDLHREVRTFRDSVLVAE